MDNNSKKIVLKRGRERPVMNRHHWVFSGAIASKPPVLKGEILPVYSHDNDLLGHAYCNSKVSITGRMICFGKELPQETVARQIRQSIQLRKSLFDPSRTNAYRIINGEGDCLPGLIVDKYDHTLVIQIMTLGMEKLKDLIVSELVKALNPKSIYEKSTHGSRKEEGMDLREGTIYGEKIESVQIFENGLKYDVSLTQGQKTGFFLDQREMRSKIQELSRGKNVLNCFSYSGGFSIAALAGGANKAFSIDTSGNALEMAKKNAALNGFSDRQHSVLDRDVFAFLEKEPLNYDIIILDPPAFAKKKEDVKRACGGYRELNRLAMQGMPRGSLLLTCSCSSHIDVALFQNLIFQAAAGTDKNVQIIGRHILAPDHPINIYHPETDYLKSLLVYVS